MAAVRRSGSPREGNRETKPIRRGQLDRRQGRIGSRRTGKVPSRARKIGAGQAVRRLRERGRQTDSARRSGKDRLRLRLRLRVTLQPNEAGQENHANKGSMFVVRALARLRRTGYGLKAALRTPRFIRLKCYDYDYEGRGLSAMGTTQRTWRLWVICWKTAWRCGKAACGQ